MTTPDGPINGAYERTILTTAGTVISMETATGKKLAVARLALHEAIQIAEDLGDDEDIYRRAIVNASKHVLEANVVIDCDDEDEFMRFS